PSFGPERRGAPVIAFARVSGEPIRLRTAVRNPSLVIVLDPSLLRLVPVADGMVEGGTLVVNSPLTAGELRKKYGFRGRLAVVDANHIAREEIGRVITNTTMLGAAMRAVPLVGAEQLEQAIRNRFGRIADRNLNAFRRALEQCRVDEG
ncbi:MAG: pyruvate synthase, partial [Deltaproteobacteria bacterium]